MKEVTAVVPSMRKIIQSFSLKLDTVEANHVSFMLLHDVDRCLINCTEKIRQVVVVNSLIKQSSIDVSANLWVIGLCSVTCGYYC